MTDDSVHVSVPVPTIKGIYLGNRGKEFKTLIRNVLKKGDPDMKYAKTLTTSDNLEKYAAAFTSEQVDYDNNYQVYEQIGDLSANKFIVSYMYAKFPRLKKAECVKIVARVRINYGSKNTFSKIAEDLGFWPFISATNELRNRKKKSLLEDVLEAFLGVTEMLMDEEIQPGMGYPYVCRILKAIFDGMNISLKYEDLYDAKTRLKELFDMLSEQLGVLKYEDIKDELVTHVMVYRLEGASYEVRADGRINPNRVVGPRKKILLGKGSAALKADAEQIAAAEAIKTLASQGYVKKPPLLYAKISEKETKEPDTTEEDVLRKCDMDKEKINEQFFTRGKSKYQAYYTSTVLTWYCYRRDYQGIKICLKLGADPNIVDSEGMTATDMLLIGKSKEKLVRKVIDKFTKSLKVGDKLKIHRNVYDIYLAMYSDIPRDNMEIID